MNDVPWDIKMPNMLLGLRVTPCTSTNKSPAELLMNRRLRTLLDTIHPDNKKRVIQEQQIIHNAQTKCRQSDIGQSVMYRNFSKGAPRWLQGTVVSREGPASYQVETQDGSVVNRHIDQLIKQKQSEADFDKEAEQEKMCVEREELDRTKEQDGSSLVNEEIIEIPSSDKWAEMLGIPEQSDIPTSSGEGMRHFNFKFELHHGSTSSL
ncbi:hypothetical protein ACJJTC_018438 [Scirpophaga incertulas]